MRFGEVAQVVSIILLMTVWLPLVVFGAPLFGYSGGLLFAAPTIIMFQLSQGRKRGRVSFSLTLFQFADMIRACQDANESPPAEWCSTY